MPKETAAYTHSNTFLGHPLFCVPSHHPQLGLQGKCLLRKSPRVQDVSKWEERAHTWGGVQWEEPKAGVGKGGQEGWGLYAGRGQGEQMPRPPLVVGPERELGGAPSKFPEAGWPRGSKTGPLCHRGVWPPGQGRQRGRAGGADTALFQKDKAQDVWVSLPRRKTDFCVHQSSGFYGIKQALE